MIEATRRWFRRNRTNLLIGAGVLGAGYLAGQYVIGKIQEARQRIAEDRIAKENLRRRFEQNQEDCTYTVLALLPTVREEIIGALPVEHITEQLQQERHERLKKLGAYEAPSSELPSSPPSVTDDASLAGSYLHASQMGGSGIEGSASSSRPRRSKAQLWQEMKINSIARAVSLIYTIALLTMLTRIQLNLLGRRTYLSSVVALASPPPPMEDSRISLENRDDDNYDNMYGNDFETNRKYLTFSWWLLHRGSKQIMDRVIAVVKEVFGPINIREAVTLERLADLTMQVRTKIEGVTEAERRHTKWLSCLLPPRESESFVIRQSNLSESEDSPSPEARTVEGPMTASAVEAEVVDESLRRLLDETSDLIDSPAFTHVLTRLLDTSFSQLIDYRIATEAFQASGTAAPGVSVAEEEQPRITEMIDTKCKIAHILPIFCKQAHTIAAGSGDLDSIAGAALEQSLGNEYLAAMDQVHDLNAFAAVIYSSNFEHAVGENANTMAPQSEGRSPSPESQSVDDPVREQTSISPQGDAPDAEPASTNESGVLLPTADEPSSSATGQGGGLFESAWKRALNEDDK